MKPRLPFSFAASQSGTVLSGLTSVTSRGGTHLEDTRREVHVAGAKKGEFTSTQAGKGQHLEPLAHEAAARFE